MSSVTTPAVRLPAVIAMAHKRPRHPGLHGAATASALRFEQAGGQR